MRRLACVLLAIVLIMGCSIAESLTERRERMMERGQRIAGWLYDGEFDSIAAEFDGKLLKPEDKTALETLWAQIEALLGDFVERKSVSCNIIKGICMVTIKDEFTLDRLTLQINFDENDLIMGLEMKLDNADIAQNDAPANFDHATIERLCAESLLLSEALVLGEYGKIVERTNDEIRGGFDESTIRAGMEQLMPLLGEYVECSDARYALQDGYLLVEIDEQFENKILNVRFVYDGREELMGFHFNTSLTLDEMQKERE